MGKVSRRHAVAVAKPPRYCAPFPLQKATASNQTPHFCPFLVYQFLRHGDRTAGTGWLSHHVNKERHSRSTIVGFLLDDSSKRSSSACCAPDNLLYCIKKQPGSIQCFHGTPYRGTHSLPPLLCCTAASRHRSMPPFQLPHWSCEEKIICAYPANSNRRYISGIMVWTYIVVSSPWPSLKTLCMRGEYPKRISACVSFLARQTRHHRGVYGSLAASCP